MQKYLLIQREVQKEASLMDSDHSELHRMLPQIHDS